MANALVGERKKNPAKRARVQGSPVQGRGSYRKYVLPCIVAYTCNNVGECRSWEVAARKARVAECPNDEPSELN